MSMMEGIAATASAMSAVNFQQSYALAVTKKAMDSQELAAQELLRMMPQAPAKGQYIDIYA